MQNQPDVLRGTLYGILAASIWGSMYVVSDVVLQIIPPFTLLSLRILLGLFVLVLLTYRSVKRQIPSYAVLFRLIIVGVVGIGISLGAQFVGTDKSTAVNGALVTSASPAFIVLFAILVLREKLTTFRLLAILLASIGVFVILDPAQADFGSDTFIGDLFLTGAALSWGLYSVLIRWVTTTFSLDTNVVTIFAFVGGLLVSIPASLIELPSRPIGDIDAGVVIGVLYLGIVSTAGAMWLWNRSFALVPASVASLFFFAQPFSGALLASVFLGQPMTISLWLGGFLIVIGVFISLWRPQHKRIVPLETS